MKRELDYIFLDLDGPILEGKNRHFQCYSEILKDFGGTPLNSERYWNLKRARVPRDQVLEASKFGASYETFANEWMERIESEKFLSFDVLKPKIRETLSEWRELFNNVSIELVTMRQSRPNLEAQLKRLNVIDCFDVITDCPPMRANTKYQALKGRKFNRAIFIGDTEEDVNTAKLLGIPSIGVLNGIRDKEYLLADYFANEIVDINFSHLDYMT